MPRDKRARAMNGVTFTSKSTSSLDILDSVFQVRCHLLCSKVIIHNNMRIGAIQCVICPKI